ncbi:ATP-grasp domain-containing protein [Raoultibacter phocaeensis]|uniref:ATP-grasp domain-containing protein n=1 Tax=Raoultibacter phocaeensis TaxID=2479841 RepID=UPI0011190133|nr:ATP-grasp domain-containing protein [Raoultibacter phocaeensis]
MIMLEEPFVSETLIAWLEDSQHPVLDNAMARRVAADHAIALCPEDEAVSRIEAGERLYTSSENALAWLAQHVKCESITRPLEMFKDKALMRRVLAPLDPDFFFMTCAADELPALDFSELKPPFVLKPSVGFCSVGVYAIADEADWKAALADIERNAASWRDMYPESVIGASEFVLEGYIEGTEYAIDAYWDAEGKAHVLDVLRHDFASPSDTSDRMYCTGVSIVSETAPRFAAWLDLVNELVGAKNFPVHVEVRVSGDVIRPIEFNPLRFAGLGGTDVSWFAYGFRTYECFLQDELPDWERIGVGREGKLYTMSVLGAPSGMEGDERFDYEAFRARFSHVLCLRQFDYHAFGNFGFLFLETDEDDDTERVFLMNSDLREFIRE